MRVDIILFWDQVLPFLLIAVNGHDSWPMIDDQLVAILSSTDVLKF